MLKGLFNITFTAEIITFLAAIFLLNKKTGRWQWFQPYLLLILITEIGGWYLSWKLHRENVWVYNIYQTINVCFCLWILSMSGVMKLLKPKVSMICLGILVWAIITMFFLNGFNTYNSNAEIAYDIIIALTCCYLIFQLLRAASYRNLTHDEYFWLANGLLVFSLGSAVLSVGRWHLQLFQTQTGMRLSEHINDILNILLYASFIIAFICRRTTEPLT